MLLKNRLKEILDEKGKDYRWLAQLLKKSVTMIRNWCENKIQPSLPTLEVIANSLQIDTRDTIQQIHDIMENNIDKERAIRSIVCSAVKSYANGFSMRHLSEVDDEDGVINMKINNVFIAALGSEIQYYSALARSLDSSLGNMLEDMAISIAMLNYDVTQHVEGAIYQEQTDYIAELLERYKNTKGENHKKPEVCDYKGITQRRASAHHSKRHESDYYLKDTETGMSYLIELKIGGDLDNKKARSEKEALLEQYCILANQEGEENVKILFATAYNRYGEGKPWTQGRVRQFFADEELCISSDFWNLVCKDKRGYDIVIDEYRKNAHFINEALDEIKKAYLPDES